jgi:hypothetical protein
METVIQMRIEKWKGTEIQEAMRIPMIPQYRNSYPLDLKYLSVSQADTCHKHDPKIELRLLSYIYEEGNNLGMLDIVQLCC